MGNIVEDHTRRQARRPGSGRTIPGKEVTGDRDVINVSRRDIIRGTARSAPGVTRLGTRTAARQKREWSGPRAPERTPAEATGGMETGRTAGRISRGDGRRRANENSAARISSTTIVQVQTGTGNSAEANRGKVRRPRAPEQAAADTKRSLERARRLAPSSGAPRTGESSWPTSASAARAMRQSKRRSLWSSR